MSLPNAAAWVVLVDVSIPSANIQAGTMVDRALAEVLDTAGVPLVGYGGAEGLSTTALDAAIEGFRGVRRSNPSAQFGDFVGPILASALAAIPAPTGNLAWGDATELTVGSPNAAWGTNYYSGSDPLTAVLPTASAADNGRMVSVVRAGALGDVSFDGGATTVYAATMTGAAVYTVLQLVWLSGLGAGVWVPVTEFVFTP